MAPPFYIMWQKKKKPFYNSVATGSIKQEPNRNRENICSTGSEPVQKAFLSKISKRSCKIVQKDQITKKEGPSTCFE